MNPSCAVSVVRSSINHNFVNLRRSRVHVKRLDEFERFLKASGTLSRPSLIIRLRLARHQFSVETVVDKPISQRRLSDSLLPFLERIKAHIEGSVDCFILLSDNIYVSSHALNDFLSFLDNVPFLRCDRRRNDESSMRSILIPDFSILHGNYAASLFDIVAASQRIPFSERIPIVKWRGSLSGITYPDIDNYHEFPRFNLLQLSHEFPQIIDAQLTNHDGMNDTTLGRKLIDKLHQNFGPPVPFVPIEEFVSYRYLVSLDGAVSAWQRVPTILASGSVLLLQHQWEQFFYPALQPWLNYVPLSDDLSDILQSIQWLNTHSIEAQAIAGKGQALAKAVLQPSQIELFFKEILSHCSELFDG